MAKSTRMHLTNKPTGRILCGAQIFIESSVSRSREGSRGTGTELVPCTARTFRRPAAELYAPLHTVRSQDEVCVRRTRPAR
jgi:hypothetical protein